MGGSFVLTSPDLAGAPLPTVKMGVLTAPVTRVNDSTVSGTVPAVWGSVSVTVLTAHDTVSLGDWVVGGFEFYGVGSGLWGILRPVSGPPGTVIGNGDSGLVIQNIFSGQVTAYPTTVHNANCDWGAGLTPDPNQFIFATSDTGSTSCRFSTWETQPSLSFVDTTPVHSPPALRIVAELSPHEWLVTTHNFFTTFNDSSGTDTLYSGDLDGVVISPSGNRVAVNQAYNASSEVPVLDAATGSPAYLVPTRWSEGAAFSPGGDTLFLVGGDTLYGQGPAKLLVLRASDGAVLESIPLALAQPGAVSLDPEGKWIYVSGVYDSNHVSYHMIGAYLEVFDRATLAPVATLQSDSFHVNSANAFANEHLIVADPAGHRAVILSSDILADLPASATRYLVSLGFVTP